jgi:predicted DsbA family dithiol-disulfide isomerase
MEAKKIKIEIWSDVVCPFCYTGKKKMERAIANLKAQDQLEISWRSFQLDPDFPAGTSIPSVEDLSERKGFPIDQIKEMCNQLALEGKPYNIDFKLEQSRAFNTLTAHRLIHWSKKFNKSNELKEAFMCAYSAEGIDLSVSKNLLSVIKKVGLDTKSAYEVINSTMLLEDVQADILQAQKLGIKGVPYFLINGNEVISNTQHDQVFVNMLTAELNKFVPGNH